MGEEDILLYSAFIFLFWQCLTLIIKFCSTTLLDVSLVLEVTLLKEWKQVRGRGSIKDLGRVMEEIMRAKPGYEHLNEHLHILVEAELPVEIVDARLMQAREILEELLKPVVSNLIPYPLCATVPLCATSEF
ncbi:hypothetical protein ACOSQ2_030349 [Xanthoceras sorbifolium]